MTQTEVDLATCGAEIDFRVQLAIMSLREVQPFRAFTLVELLVVIGIICLLAAIIFPVFGRVRKNSYRTSCQSNLKQLSLGIIQYTQDSDERFPLGLTQDDNGFTKTSLDLIQPYLKNRQVAMCIADSAGPSVDLTKYFSFATGNGLSSYTVNDKICTLEYPPSSAVISQPTRIPLLWDAYIAKDDNVPPYVYLEVERRHFDGANCAFVDGHVKWYQTHPPLSDPIPGKEDAYWNAPPDDNRP